MRPNKLIASLLSWGLCFFSGTQMPSIVHAADLTDLSTPERINTQLITKDSQTTPYAITGESLVHLIASMVSFDVAGSSIVFNRSSGQLVIKNTPDNISRIENILSSLRTSSLKQIEMEARIITVGTDDIDSLGLQSLDLDNREYFRSSNDKGFFDIGNDETTEIMFPDRTTRTSGTDYFGHEFAFGLGTKNLGAGAVIDALKSKAEVNTLSAPRLTVFNNQRAYIRISSIENFVSEVDTEVKSTGDSGSSTIFFSTEVKIRKAPSGTMLDVTPTINNDGTITLSLHPTYIRSDLSTKETIESVSYDSAAEASNDITLPVFTQQAVDTTVVIPDGGTAMIGGLIDEQENKAFHKIPGISSIPLIGRFFTNKNNRDQQTYLIMFIKATSSIAKKGT